MINIKPDQTSVTLNFDEFKYMFFTKKTCPKCTGKMKRESEKVFVKHQNYTTTTINGTEKYVHSAGRYGYSTMSNEKSDIPNEYKKVFYYRCLVCNERFELTKLAEGCKK